MAEAIHQFRKAALEHIIVMQSPYFAAQVQQAARRLVGGHDFAICAKGHHGIAQPAQRAVVPAHPHPQSRRYCAQQRGFDDAGAVLHQREHTELGQGRIARDIDGATQFALHAVDGCGGALEAAMLGKEMFLSEHADGLSLGHGGTHGAGTNACLGQVHTRAQRTPDQFATVLQRAVHGHRMAVGIGQQQTVSALAQYTCQPFEFRASRLDQVMAAFTQGRHHAGLDRIEADRLASPVANALAALPRAQHGIGHQTAGQRAFLEEQAACGADAFRLGQCSRRQMGELGHGISRGWDAALTNQACGTACNPALGSKPCVCNANAAATSD